MSVVRALKQFSNSLLHPTPYWKTEMYKLLNLKFEYLSMDNIGEIIRIILEEVDKSKKFGLFIKPEHVRKEEVAFLTALNSMGNIHNIRNHIPWEQIETFLKEVAENLLAEEMKYYFDLAKKNNEAVNNKYLCHIYLGVIPTLLYEIYSKTNKNFEL